MDNRQDLEQERLLKLSRRFAPIPKRKRAFDASVHVDGSNVPLVNGPSPTLEAMAVQAYQSANELAKAAEELLEHFDQASLLRDGGKAAGRGALADGKENRRIVMDNRGLHEDGSESSGGGEIEVKLSGLMTPDESSLFKNGLSDDGNHPASIADSYTNPGDWNVAPASTATGSTSSSSRREHDCEHDGCYEMTSRFVDDDRLSDDYAARGGGKKRKVPASAQQGPLQSAERDENTCVHSCGHVCSEATTSSILNTMNRHVNSTDSGETNPNLSDTPHDQQSCPHVRCCDRHSSIRIVPDPIIKVPKRRMTPARTAMEFEKRLFHARKAQVLGLHADAVTCLGQSKQKNASVPSKDELEELVKTLEYTGVTGWEGDRVGSGAGLWEGHVLRGRVKNGVLMGKLDSATSTTVATSTAEPGNPSQPSQQATIRPPGKLNWRKQGRIAERHGWRSRKPVKRGGWIPEGTFEFEMPSTVSSTLQKSTQNLNALRAKVTQLLTLTLSSPSMTSFLNGKPIPSGPTVLPPASSSRGEPKPKVHPSAADTHVTKVKPNNEMIATKAVTDGKREPLAAEKVHHANGVPANAETSPTPGTTKPAPPLASSEKNSDQPEQTPRSNNRVNNNSHNVIVEPSADDPDYVPPPFSNVAGAKKGKKKKKKSALANAANPHHVKNYVPSRRPVNASQADMPNLVDFLSTLFFPPPTRFLNSKPRRKDVSEDASQTQQKPEAARRRDTQNRPGADQTDEEYVCCFCEYDLFFGSEQAMSRAVQRRKKVLDRRQKAQEKAKGVMAGKGLRNKAKRGGDDGESDEDRCAGGEQCRCAEIRAQEQSDDADSRGIEDTQYADEGGDVSESLDDEFEDDADEPEIESTPPMETGAHASSPVDVPYEASVSPSEPATRNGEAYKTILPEVETFDLEEVPAS